MPLCGLFNPENVWDGLGLYVRRLIEMLEMTNEAGVTRLWGREEQCFSVTATYVPHALYSAWLMAAMAKTQHKVVRVSLRADVQDQRQLGDSIDSRGGV